MSEVCGASADIHLAMNEFRDCILGTGLIHLPVQGELFLGIIAVKEIVAYGNVRIECWLMMLGYDCGRIRIINVLTLGLPITPHLCSEEILINIRRREFIDLRYLRPWARHVLTQEESQALVQSVSREEIKDAFFDIAEDKAPGPDGYSSGFYKAAWPVIGEEMIKAILEFFTTGRLLKQVNTTILALIPKTGLPMRCALKVDLRKAYDTVDGISLVPCYKCLDFRAPLLDGLRSVSLLLCSRYASMGTLTVSSRVPGVKTRGSDVPVLVRSDYGDDLLLFCKADVDSVRVFRHGLDEFAKLSGLHANPQKSQLILSRSARMSGNNYLQHYISRRVTFPSGTLDFLF
ncbi:hypothetical protein Sango_3062400 [Sesamum angolense]|uniref:Reverse transcriptase n=1 Tax=Sesamum angolense TaxID=2727404 RepID=A0AAE1TA75_9LAMI|nr:hypothetical protein Sango_3062400 [Sesamum angolense]